MTLWRQIYDPSKYETVFNLLFKFVRKSTLWKCVGYRVFSLARTNALVIFSRDIIFESHSSYSIMQRPILFSTVLDHMPPLLNYIKKNALWRHKKMSRGEPPLILAQSMYKFWRDQENIILVYEYGCPQMTATNSKEYHSASAGLHEAHRACALSNQ